MFLSVCSYYSFSPQLDKMHQLSPKAIHRVFSFFLQISILFHFNSQYTEKFFSSFQFIIILMFLHIPYNILVSIEFSPMSRMVPKWSQNKFKIRHNKLKDHNKRPTIHILYMDIKYWWYQMSKCRC